MDIEGAVASGFEGVQEAFVANFEEHGDVGAAVAVYAGGEKVVDLWAGVADEQAGTPWQEDTLALVYSTTKGVTSICVHLLVQRGLLDLDAPVSELWPELEAAKTGLTVRELLGHRAGLAAFDDPVPVADVLAWDPMVERLGSQVPLWEPRTAHGYHALTFGWLAGELVRRTTGRSLGQFLAEEVSGPLGLDLWVGLPESEEHRVSRLLPAPAPDAAAMAAASASLTPALLAMVTAMADPTSLTVRSLQVATPPLNFNSREVHAAELPAANGIATARSLARLYAATVGEVDGIRLLEDATVADACQEVSAGPDAVLHVDTRFGAGFFLSSSFSPLMGPRSFGHAGAGGSLAFADPDAGVGFAYVMNQMRQNISNDLRTTTLIDAVRAAL